MGPAWSLLLHDLVCRPVPGVSRGCCWGRSHPRKGRSRARAPGQALCLLSGSKGPGPQLLGSVSGGAPQPRPPSGAPIPRGRASPKKEPPTLTRLPGNSHGPEAAKSRQSRLAPGSHAPLTSGSPPSAQRPFGKTWGSFLWFPQASSSGFHSKKSFQNGPLASRLHQSTRR